MVLPDKVYDALVWIVALFIPSFNIAYSALAKVWGFPMANEISMSINIVNAFLAAILGISKITYDNNTK